MDFSLDQILAFIEANHAWGAALFGLLAFGESLVLVGILMPGTGVLLAMGPLVGNGTLPLGELMLTGALGALIGDLVSYWIGRRIGIPVRDSRFMQPHRPLVDRAVDLFRQWGWLAVFFGRFIGPLRATVPFVAGMLQMREWSFVVVSAVSAVLWVPVLLAPGALIGHVIELYRAGDTTTALVLGLGGLVVIAAAILGFRRFLARRARAPEPR